MEKMVNQEITAENFSEYFRDVRDTRPQPGDIMAKFIATADLVEGPDGLKQELLDLLLRPNGAKSCVKLLQRLAGCRYENCLRLLQEMGQDLATQSTQYVLDKPYRFVCEFFFYCQREHVPNSPHWETIPLIDSSKWKNFDKVMEQVEASQVVISGD